MCGDYDYVHDLFLKAYVRLGTHRSDLNSKMHSPLTVPFSTFTYVSYDHVLKKLCIFVKFSSLSLRILCECGLLSVVYVVSPLWYCIEHFTNYIDIYYCRSSIIALRPIHIYHTLKQIHGTKCISKSICIYMDHIKVPDMQ